MGSSISIRFLGADGRHAAGAGSLQQGGRRSAARPAPQVTVLAVQGRDIPFTPSFVAQTESSRQVNIVARVSGFLDRIAYQEGELVKEGQLLFQLDPKPFQAQVEAARGALQSQQARLTTAQANLGRVKPLAEQNALSQSDLDRAQGEFDAAKAAVYSAQASLTQAELNLGYATIRSPVTGLAGRALQRQGAFVNSMAESANLTYVAAIDPIWVSFSISQNQAARWAEEVAWARWCGRRTWTTRSTWSCPTARPSRRRAASTSPTRPSAPTPARSRCARCCPTRRCEMRPGMFVTALMKGAVRPNAIVVPQLAVQQGSNGHLVYVVNAAGQCRSATGGGGRLRRREEHRRHQRPEGR